MNRLEAKLANEDEYDEDNPKVWKLKIKGFNEAIIYPKEVRGTHLNLLPYVFMKHLDYSLPKGDRKALNDLFKISSKVKKDPDFIELQSKCKDYIGLFEKMLDLFENDDVQKVSIDAYYRQQNIDNLLERLYDKEVVEEIYEKQLPLVYQHINRLIVTLDWGRRFYRRLFSLCRPEWKGYWQKVLDYGNKWLLLLPKDDKISLIA